MYQRQCVKRRENYHAPQWPAVRWENWNMNTDLIEIKGDLLISF